MQTFLPLPSFVASAKVLDRQRLGKQRVECLQILQAIHHGTRWSSHPCTKMWASYPGSLISYGVAICDEWTSRGYRDTCKGKILATCVSSQVTPKWLTEAFCASHRRALLRKNYEHYSQYNWPEQPAELIDGKIPYIWG